MEIEYYKVSQKIIINKKINLAYVIIVGNI